MIGNPYFLYPYWDKLEWILIEQGGGNHPQGGQKQLQATQNYAYRNTYGSNEWECSKYVDA
jgi:hypothetical protein